MINSNSLSFNCNMRRTEMGVLDWKYIDEHFKHKYEFERRNSSET